MTATLRVRAEHAAKYGAHLVVPAREIKHLLDQLAEARASIQAVQAVCERWETSRDAHRPLRVTASSIRRALDSAALAEGGEQR